MNNLKEEFLIDEFGNINEDIFLEDIKKTLMPYFKEKIEKNFNKTKFDFLLK